MSRDGGALVTYSILTRETRKKYAMNKIRAGLYALSIGLLLFSLFTETVARFAMGKYIAFGSLMAFSLASIGWS